MKTPFNSEQMSCCKHCWSCAVPALSLHTSATHSPYFCVVPSNIKKSKPVGRSPVNPFWCRPSRLGFEAVFLSLVSEEDEIKHYIESIYPVENSGRNFTICSSTMISPGNVRKDD